MNEGWLWVRAMLSGSSIGSHNYTGKTTNGALVACAPDVGLWLSPLQPLLNYDGPFVSDLATLS